MLGRRTLAVLLVRCACSRARALLRSLCPLRPFLLGLCRGSLQQRIPLHSKPGSRATVTQRRAWMACIAMHTSRTCLLRRAHTLSLRHGAACVVRLRPFLPLKSHAGSVDLLPNPSRQQIAQRIAYICVHTCINIHKYIGFLYHM